MFSITINSIVALRQRAQIFKAVLWKPDNNLNTEKLAEVSAFCGFPKWLVIPASAVTFSLQDLPKRMITFGGYTHSNWLLKVI